MFESAVFLIYVSVLFVWSYQMVCSNDMVWHNPPSTLNHDNNVKHECGLASLNIGNKDQLERIASVHSIHYFTKHILIHPFSSSGLLLSVITNQSYNINLSLKILN